MAVAVTHATAATLPNNAEKEISSDAWNEEHSVTGLGTAAEADTGDFDAAGTAAAAVAAHEGAANPHPTYLTEAEGDAAYADIAHTHDGLAPSGGTTGQVLKKDSNTDFDYSWQDDETSVGGGVDTANSPNANEFARFTDADTIEGRTATETRSDLSLAALALLNTVGSSQIDDAAVTLAKMENRAEATVIGRAAGAGTGAPTALSAAQLITLIGAAATPISQVAIKTVEASGDYTPTAGMKYCICILTGSGGGGGGADSSTTTNDIGVGGGGGAGTTRIGFFTAAAIGASKAVVLNAGGTAGSATNGTTGGTPSDNTFGSTLLVAPGGLGGPGSGVATEALNAQLGGAGGGAGSGGVFGSEGGAGGSAIALTNDATVGDGSMGIGGIGGSSFWGGGGRGGALFSTTVGVAATSAGTAGKAHGSGGGGAVCSDTAAGADGGAGKIGIFVAIEFI